MLGCSVSHRLVAPSVSGVFKWRQFEPQSRHGVAMGPALRPGNGTTFALKTQTDQRWLNSNKGTKCDIESRATRILAGASTLQSPVSECAGSIPHRLVCSPPGRSL